MDQLKEARIKASITIEQVSKDLNIRKHYIVAIEEGNFDIIPGAAYTKGYIQLYAKYLGLDLSEQEKSTESNNSDKQILCPSQILMNFKWSILITILLLSCIFLIKGANGLGETQNQSLIYNLENMSPVNYLSGRSDIFLDSDQKDMIKINSHAMRK